MVCSNTPGVCKSRKPEENSLCKLLSGNSIEFEEIYDEPFQKKYEFYHPVIPHVVRNCLPSIFHDKRKLNQYCNIFL